MPLLGKFASTKAITAVLGTLVLVGLRSKAVSNTQPVLGCNSGNLTLSTNLVRAFPEEGEKIILSGTPVTLKLKIMLCKDGESEKEKVVVRKVSYDLLSSFFPSIQRRIWKKSQIEPK